MKLHVFQPLKWRVLRAEISSCSLFHSFRLGHVVLEAAAPTSTANAFLFYPVHPGIQQEHGMGARELMIFSNPGVEWNGLLLQQQVYA